jgi:hypothetical protein
MTYSTVFPPTEKETRTMTSTDSTIPFIGDRIISHDTLAELEGVAFEAEGDPAVTFEAVNLITRTETELWVLAGMLARRGMYRHAQAVAETAEERHSEADRYLQELHR